MSLWNYTNKVIWVEPQYPAIIGLAWEKYLGWSIQSLCFLPSLFLLSWCFLRCLSHYLSTRYRQAEQSSFTVQARGFEEDRMSLGHWDQSEAASAVAGHASSVASPSQVEERKVDVVKSGCLSFFPNLWKECMEYSAKSKSSGFKMCLTAIQDVSVYQWIHWRSWCDIFWSLTL